MALLKKSKLSSNKQKTKLKLSELTFAKIFNFFIRTEIILWFPYNVEEAHKLNEMLLTPMHYITGNS